jgi:hypothetical protein
MSGQLEATHEQLADEVTGVQRVGRWIEADVQPDVALGETGGQQVAIGRVVNEPAGVEFGKQIHSGAPCCQVSAAFTHEIWSKFVADLAELTRRFRAFADTAGSRSPLYATLSRVVADDPRLVAVMQVAPEEQHNPVLLFVAVHDLLLRGLGPDLAAFYPNLATEPEVGDVAPAFRSFVLDHLDPIRELVATRNTQTNEVGRCSLFLPVLARLGQEYGQLALAEVGASAGLNLLLARYSYEYLPGGSVGPQSTVHLTCGTRGNPPIPATMPTIAATIGLDVSPIDVHDADQTRWLEACVWPDQSDRFARLRASLEIARKHPPAMVKGDAVSDVVETIEGVAGLGHPVVMNSWVLNYLSEARQREYVDELDRFGAQHDLSWVLAESPAQTPGLPIPSELEEHATVLSLVRWRGGVRHVERLAVCHPHGYWMHWQRDGTR